MHNMTVPAMQRRRWRRCVERIGLLFMPTLAGADTRPRMQRISLKVFLHAFWRSIIFKRPNLKKVDSGSSF